MDNGTYEVSRGSHRLNAIEGLRGYLAFWVLTCHVLWASGFETTALSGLPKLLRQGAYAVDLFIIVSGFAIFLSLDKRQVSYQQFVVRRFFRLFPLLIALFAIAIPLSNLSMWNATHATQYLTPHQIQSLSDKTVTWWDNIYWHVPLHLFMFHGTIPDSLIPDASGAFLIPGWSVSLEWQFYLLAPLAYAAAVSSKPVHRLGLCGLCLLMFLGARYVIPPVRYGAALPFHVEFFFLGAASYFVYKYRSAYQIPDTWFPVACGISLVLLLNGQSWPLIPIGLWIAFLGLILEQPTSFSSRVIARLFTNPLMQYLGRISYSVYLSHILIIIVVQYALLVGAPQLSRMMHFVILLCSTFICVIAVAALLYRFVEAPGIRYGRSVTGGLAERLGVGAPEDRTISSYRALQVSKPEELGIKANLIECQAVSDTARLIAAAKTSTPK